MMECTDIKKGILVQTGELLGIVLHDDMKFSHSNHYTWVYYFNSRHHKDNPCWVFLGNLNNVKRATQ